MVNGEWRQVVPTWRPIPARMRLTSVFHSHVSHLTSHFAAPALDDFLYGPVDDGHTILRNPQGMALAGTTLLVCDQGYQDVIGINLANGRSWSWADREHLPKCPVGITVG